MNYNELEKILDGNFLLLNKNEKVEIRLNDVMDYNFYNNIEEFIKDHSYLLKESESENDILSNPVSFNDFMNFIDSNIKFSDQTESVFYARAKNNDDAEYHLYLIKSLELSKENILNVLNDIVTEYDGDSNYRIEYRREQGK